MKRCASAAPPAVDRLSDGSYGPSVPDGKKGCLDCTILDGYRSNEV